MAGSVGAPTPWWQLPGGGIGGQAAAVANLDASAPPGYTYDRVAMKYVPIAGSPTDVLAQRSRTQSIEDNQIQSADALRNRLLGMFGSSMPSGSGGGSGATVDFNYSGGAGPSSISREGFSAPTNAPIASVADIAPPDTSVAQANVFARAKDQVGKQTGGGVTALRSALAARGLLGGGEEYKGTSRILQTGAEQLGDTSREQAIQESNRLNDFAKLGYEGAITQRGQNITQNEGAASRALAAATTGYEGNIRQREQDINASDAAAQRALDAAKTAYQGKVTQRGQDVDARANAATSLNTLMSRLY